MNYEEFPTISRVSGGQNNKTGLLNIISGHREEVRKREREGHSDNGVEGNCAYLSQFYSIGLSSIRVRRGKERHILNWESKTKNEPLLCT